MEVGLSRRWREVEDPMSPRRLSAALAQRLGHDATNGLVELLDAEKDTMLSVAAERFERRLTEEISGLRVDLVRELHGMRADLFKWSFLFWIGQLAAVIGVLTFMLRNRP
jgi:hypothetical protein